MANTKVEIRVDTTASKEVYVCGSTKALGAWDPKHAIKLEQISATTFSVSKLMATGEVVEFKVLSGKSWDNVEKGSYGEEIQNHLLTPSKGLVEVVVVSKFNK